MIGRINHYDKRNPMVRRLGFTSFSVILLAFVCTLGLASSLQAAVATPQRPLITQQLDENLRVTIKGNTRPEANAANDRGPVADAFQMEHMLLQLQRSADQEQAVEEFIDQLHNPASSNFHQWLTAQEFGETFGLAEEDLDVITTWLQSHGFQVNVVYPNGMLIDFSGTAGQVREAFRTEIHHLEVNGVEHIANMSDPQIPAALHRRWRASSRCTISVPHPMHKLRRNYTFTASGADLSDGDARGSGHHLQSEPAVHRRYLGPGPDHRGDRRHQRLQHCRLDHLPQRPSAFPATPPAASRRSIRRRPAAPTTAPIPASTATTAKRSWTRNGPAPPRPVRPSSWPPARTPAPPSAA